LTAGEGKKGRHPAARDENSSPINGQQSGKKASKRNRKEEGKEKKKGGMYRKWKKGGGDEKKGPYLNTLVRRGDS